MDNYYLILRYRLFLQLIMGILFSFQIISVGIKKRLQGNFLDDNSFINTLIVNFGFFIIGFEFFMISTKDPSAYNSNYLLLISVIIFFTISLVVYLNKSKNYSVYNITDNELDLIINKVFIKYKIKLDVKKEYDDFKYKIDSGIGKSAVIKVKNRGLFKKWISINIKRYKYLYHYDNLIEDIKDKVNESTKVNKNRGMGELISAFVVLIFILFIYNMNVI